MRRQHRSRVVQLLLILLCLSATARATVLVPIGLDQLAREAGAIVRGRVIAVETRTTADRRAIDTLVTVQAEATLKGSLGASVQFVVPGGSIGRYRTIFVGAPAFEVGQRVVVFLGWRGPSYPYLIGFSQGVYRIQSDAAGLSRVIPPPISAPPSGVTAVVRGDPARRTLTLEEFEQRVRALVVPR